MKPLQIIFLRMVLLTAGFLSILLIMLSLSPNKTFLSGLILGLLLSTYNVFQLALRLHKITETVSTGEKKTRGTGMITRFVMVALFLVIAGKLPHIFDLLAVIIGYPLGYIINIIAYFQVREDIEFTKEVKAKDGADTKG